MGARSRPPPEDSWQRDRAKRNHLTLRGWAILQLTWEDLTERPDWVLASLSSVLRFPQQTGQEPPKCPQARGYAAPLHLNGSIPSDSAGSPGSDGASGTFSWTGVAENGTSLTGVTTTAYAICAVIQ